MLVLTRKVGEGVRIGGELIVSVILKSIDYIEIQVTDSNLNQQLHTLAPDSQVLIADSIRFTLVRIKDEYVRIGLDFPKELTIERIDLPS